MKQRNQSDPGRTLIRNVPPPVYRPLATALLQQKTASLAAPASSGAPPVYRPFAAASQRKTAAAPPVYRPVAPASQPKNASPAAALRSGAPPVYRPQQSIVVATVPSARQPSAPGRGLAPNANPQAAQLQPAAQGKIAQRHALPFQAGQPRSTILPAPVVQRRGLFAIANHSNTRTVIQRAPTIRTLDTNLAAIKNGTGAYPGVSNPIVSDKAPGFTFNGKTYHFTFITDMYHLTDEVDGKHHYFFKIGTDSLEDIHHFPHSTSRKGHDHPLSGHPDKELLKFVQKVFNEALEHPGALARQQEEEEEIKKLALELMGQDNTLTYEEAFALAQ
jgi:hypothetical protein